MKIFFKIRKTFLGQLPYKLSRYFRSSGRTSGKSNNQKNNSRSSLTNLFSLIVSRIRSIPYYIKYIFLFIVIVLIFGIYVNYNNKINPRPLDDSSIPILTDLNEMNVATYVYEDIGGYKYVNYISFVSLNNSGLSIIQVSPLFILNDSTKITLQNILNKPKGDVTVTIEDLNFALERILGMRIDRYIIFDSTSAESFKEMKSIKVDNEDQFELFSASDLGNKDKLNLQLDYSVKFFEDKFSFFDKFDYFFNAKKYLSLLKTNMNRKEIVRFINKISSDTNVRAISIGHDHGELLITNDKAIGIYPNYLLIDEKITAFISNLTVLSEQAELEIYNSSSIGGLASSKTRELQNNGINVVKFGNYFEVIKKNTLYVNDEIDLAKYKNTIQFLNRSLRGNLDIRIGEYKYNKTGDLILVLVGE